MLQRRIALEQKNFRHQLQNEINKHKDTRHDLDLAISNADKLSTIIEMKEKMLSNAASRIIKSPTKPMISSIIRPLSKTKPGQDTARTERSEERSQLDQNIISKLCENSRNISSSLSQEEDTSSSTEPRSRYERSRTNSTSTKSTPNPTRKNSKGSNDMIELAKTVQDGMAELAIYDDDLGFKNSPEAVQKKIEALKADLMTKLKSDDTPSRRHSALRRQSTEESIEEEINESGQGERPLSRGRRNSSISFTGGITVEETSTKITLNGTASKLSRENSVLERKLPSGAPVDKYCNDIMQDIEKSNKLIEKHVKDFNTSRFESDKLVQQLQAVDKINDYVNSQGDIPEETLKELNNNFKILSEQVLVDSLPSGRKRSVSGRRNSRTESRTNLLDDTGMSNQDLLEDLLGRK
ncbi:hypothetical protein ACJJTC_001029 [Scirpophaga incertulas]